MPGESTVNQITSIYHDLCASFDRGKTTQSIFFFMVSKLYKIAKSQISRCYTKGKNSEIKAIPSGVSQGSLLGPLLFLINNITKNIESVIKVFADDTSVSLALKDPDRRAASLNPDLEKSYKLAK